MNLNIISYIIYSLIMGVSIVKIGMICHHNGMVWTQKIMPNDFNLCKQINNNLLLGYYLINLGYTILTISFWNPIFSWDELVASIASHTSQIFIILALLHYTNILIVKHIMNNKLKTKH